MSLKRALGIETRIEDWGKSLARQSELKFSDINYIMAKYEKTGVLPPATREGFFADVSSVGDYRDAVERVAMMDDYFVHLPIDVRKRFSHDPAEFLDFVSNEKNAVELEEMGVIARSLDEVPVTAVTAVTAPVEAPVEAPAEPAQE